MLTDRPADAVDETVARADALGERVSAVPAATASPPRDVSRWLGPLTVFALFIGFWYVAPSLFFSGREWLLPPPHEVINVGFIEGMSVGQLWALVKMVASDVVPFWSIDPGIDTSVVFVANAEATWLSAKVALTGLGAAILLGCGLAMAMSQAKWIEKAFYPYLIALQAVPILALVPLIGSIWGFGFFSRMLVCVIIAFFPIVANTLFGLLSAQKSHHELFALHGASRGTRLRKLMIPAALPAMFTGLRIAAGLSVVGAIVGDFFFRRGDPGLGSLLDKYFARIDQPELFAAIIMSAVLGIGVFGFFGWLRTKVIGKWHSEQGAR